MNRLLHQRILREKFLSAKKLKKAKSVEGFGRASACNLNSFLKMLTEFGWRMVAAKTQRLIPSCQLLL